jgi:SRSO17 transposase
LRLWLEERSEAYVLAVSVKEPLWVGYEQYRADALATHLAASDWFRLSCGDGTKGPRIYDWARVKLNCSTAPEWHRWLLVRRSVSDPTELAYYVVFGPASTRLEEMVSVAGTRWTIETGFETAKGEVGLDQYEVRSWQGWYRHITLSIVAHAFLSVARAQGSQQGTKKGDLNASISHSMSAFRRKRGLKFP